MRIVLHKCVESLLEHISTVLKTPASSDIHAARFCAPLLST